MENFTLTYEHIQDAPAHISIASKKAFIENVSPMCIEQKTYENGTVMYCKDDVAIRMLAMSVFTVDLLGISKDKDWFVRNDETGEFEITWGKMLDAYEYFDRCAIALQLERLKRNNKDNNDKIFQIQAEFKALETMFHGYVQDEVNRKNMLAQSQATANIVKSEFEAMLEDLKKMVTKESLESMIAEFADVQEKIKNFSPLATTVSDEDFNYDKTSKDLFKNKQVEKKYTDGKVTVLGDKRKNP